AGPHGPYPQLAVPVDDDRAGPHHTRQSRLMALFSKRSRQTQVKQPGFLTRMRASLNQGNSWLTYDLRNLLPGDKLDQEALDDLADQLMLADIGVDATQQVMDRLQTRFDGARLNRPDDPGQALRQQLGGTRAAGV